MSVRGKEDPIVVIRRKKRPVVTPSLPPLRKMEAEEKSSKSIPVAPLASPVASDEPQKGPNRSEKRRQQTIERVQQVIELLYARWPHTFPVDPALLRPLALRIRQDVITQLPEYQPWIITRAFTFWMRRHQVAYWRVLMRGGARYDLDGQPRGAVTPAEQSDARQKRKAWYAQREAMRKQDVRVAQDSPPISITEEIE